MVIDEAQAAEANRLYWKQSASVGDIANQLGISRRALYEVLQPRPAGVRCPKCGTEGVFVNRSAQAAGLARCASCDTELEAVPSASSGDPVHVTSARNSNGRLRLRVGVGSAALAGAIVGAVATFLFSQRE